jgi:DNA-binding transcriptional regulator YhcF (GntR family)
MSNTKKQYSIISVDPSLSLPIYQQIMQSVESAIAQGVLQKGDSLPSVNQIAAICEVARGSVLKAFVDLKSLGVIDSRPGKGYFVLNTHKATKNNIFLLMSTFNPYREVFYQAFMKKLGNQATVDLYFHHHNIHVFETLIQNHASHYNTFVVMPEIHQKTPSLLKQVDHKRTYLVDMGWNDFGKDYPGIYQDYEKNIYSFLDSIKNQLKLYKRSILLFSDNMRNFDIIKGFERYFKKAKLPHAIITKTETYKPEKEDFCLIMDDNDLVRILLEIKRFKWKLGKDFGLLSYNESPLKLVIGNGVSTIGPDYNQMGMHLAQLILQQEQKSLENGFIFQDRKSF